ncbi:MAG: Fe-Mn family superoxide dismutase [Myxococcota bacterium]
MLDFDFSTGALRIFAAGDHTRSIAFGAPLLVLDMYEHAYHMDYGTAAARYVDAFFANTAWSEVERRFTQARAAAKVLAAAP